MSDVYTSTLKADHGAGHGACDTNLADTYNTLAGERPDRRRMLEWLKNQAIGPNGEVYSWRNPHHPGYPYPEAAGLLLTLLASVESTTSPAQTAIAKRLLADLSATAAVGRDGVDYAFDTAMALHGLHAYAKDMDVPELNRVHDFLLTCVDQRSAHRPTTARLPKRWSTSWGCHLLKLALAIDTHHRNQGRSSCAVLRPLLASLLPLCHNGRFVTHNGSRQSYVHASCYALEGLLRLQTIEMADVRTQLRAGCEWLAAIQLEHGALPAWHDGTRGWGPQPSDIVAQSVRLWSAVDRDRYASAIARGLSHLAALQSPAGGIRYTVQSPDINTWCTVFAVQAVSWAGGDVDPFSLA